MRSDRLLKLADFLDTVPRDRFYFGTWIGHNWQGDPSLSCGTTACAVGWATTIPEFRKADLEAGVVNGETLITFEGVNQYTRNNYYAEQDSIERFFEIGESDVDFLFVPSIDLDRLEAGEALLSTASAKEVAARIRDFVRERDTKGFEAHNPKQSPKYEAPKTHKAKK